MNALSVLVALAAMQGGKTTKTQTKTPPKPKFTISVYRMEGADRIPLKSGSTIMGEPKFRVVLETTTPIQTVEFYVNDNLRESDGSIPYEFRLDTLSEDDGTSKLKFLGVTTEGERAEAAFNVKIDNGVSLGAGPHVAKGRALFSEAKYEAAIIEGRIALKADEKNVPARILLAQSHFAMGAMDKAQRYAEDARELDKANDDATNLLISVGVEQAFQTIAKSTSDRTTSLNQMRDALGSAIKARKEANIVAFDAAAADKSSVAYFDAAIRARKFGSVVSELEKRMAADFKTTALSNRYLYSLIMLNRFAEVESHLTNLKRYGEPDAYTYALEAVFAAMISNDARADSAISEAVLTNPESLGVRSAQAYLALKRNNQKGLADASRALVRDGENRPEAHYFAAALNNRAGRIPAGRKSFQLAIKANAADHDMYIEQANEAISLAQNPAIKADEQKYQYDYARTLFELALACQDNSPHALTGLAMTAMFTKNDDDALKWATAATKASPNYAGGWFVLSAAQGQKRIDVRATLATAATLDTKNLAGRSVPTPLEAFKYFTSHGRPAVLTPPARG